MPVLRSACRRLALLLLALGAAPALRAQVPFQHLSLDPNAPQDLHVKTVGDLDSDGFPDLVVASKGGAIRWYEDRSAHPSWTPHVVTGGGQGGWSTDAECGDLDGDGDDDLLVSDWYQSGRIGWFENLNGSGNAWSFHAIGAPRAHDVELADFDQDGDLDVVTRQQASAGRPLEFWRNDGGASSWVHATVTPSAAVDGEGLHARDVDADGDPDVVLPRFWLENQGGSFPWGTWVARPYTTLGIDPDAMVATGDVNGDGRLDVVTTPSELAGGSGKTRWFEAPPDPRSSGWIPHEVDGAVETVTHSLGVADMDLDGDLDVVTAEMQQGGDPDEVRIYLNLDGQGGAWQHTVVATGGSHSLRIVDLGRDGDFDLFGANWEGAQPVEVWENTLREARVGKPFCIGLAGCPCGNAGGAGEGCRNSTGAGADLVGIGSASVAADDLRLVSEAFRPGAFGVLVMSGSKGSWTVGDGKRCLAGQTFRFGVKKANPGGMLVRGPGLVAYAQANLPQSAAILPGSTWGFQFWGRDPLGPCGGGSNWSAGLEVTFLP